MHNISISHAEIKKQVFNGEIVELIAELNSIGVTEEREWIPSDNVAFLNQILGQTATAASRGVLNQDQALGIIKQLASKVQLFSMLHILVEYAQLPIYDFRLVSRAIKDQLDTFNAEIENDINDLDIDAFMALLRYLESGRCVRIDARYLRVILRRIYLDAERINLPRPMLFALIGMNLNIDRD